MRVSLIAAIASNRAIGIGNALPWRLPADQRYFKAKTMGHTLIMGRRTFESIGQRALPGRRTIVVSRRQDYAPPGVEVAQSLDEALARASGDEVFVAGGEGIFREALSRADRLYLTRIERDFPGDTFFPAFDESVWQLVERERHEATAETPFAYSFEIWERRPEP
ncbi:MAG TPA: dihydrofolate reductase [Thermoanaerobaculia bacterium]|jgi:dihydrofolate reductase